MVNWSPHIWKSEIFVVDLSQKPAYGHFFSSFCCISTFLFCHVYFFIGFYRTFVSFFILSNSIFLSLIFLYILGALYQSFFLFSYFSYVLHFPFLILCYYLCPTLFQISANNYYFHLHENSFSNVKSSVSRENLL